MKLTRVIIDSNPMYAKDLENGSIELLKGDLTQLDPSGQVVPMPEQLLCPVEPPNIFCIGANYLEHIKEKCLGDEELKIPQRPMIFMKPTTAVNHPGQPIILPACQLDGPEVDYEGELAVVIGKEALDVSQEDALSYVLGYTCANDVSARHWQKYGSGGQFIRGKGFDTFCPMGPTLVTADEIDDPQNLKIKTTVNGQVRQDGHTRDMIFPVNKLIAALSAGTTLLPGTVILTGTPKGVGAASNPPVFLKAGDQVCVEIESIGKLHNTVSH